MEYTTDVQDCRLRHMLTEQEQQQQHHHQGFSPWQRLPGFRQPPDRRVRLLQQDQPTRTHDGQNQVHAKRWEQAPFGIQLMNEICDAVSIGSDLAFWSGLIIVVIALVGLLIWLSE